LPRYARNDKQRPFWTFYEEINILFTAAHNQDGKSALIIDLGATRALEEIVRD